MSTEQTCTVRIDGREVELPSGNSLLAGALEAGIYIPHLCFHRDLPPARSTRPVEAVFRAGVRIENDGGDEAHEGCGLCVVEVPGMDGPQSACDLSVAPGMTVRTVSPGLEALRREKLARILARHPHACITCAQKEGCDRESCSTGVSVAERCCPLLGRCELEKLASYIGVPPDTPRYVPRDMPTERLGGLFDFTPELCVACLRCVRACSDLKGAEHLGFVYSRGEVVVGRLADDRVESSCRFCGACVEVCPTGALTDRLALGGDREDSLVPCRSSCPAGVDVPRFLRMVAGNRLGDAARVCLDRLPLPHVLGRVCFHPCEEGCRRTELGGPLSVCRLRRAVFETVGPTRACWPRAASTGRRVAVIGSGPAGLAAAHSLRRMGHEVTIFEAAPEAGGMLRYGIPEYRLPREVLRRDLQLLLDQGIEIRTGTSLGRELELGRLREEGFDAVLLAAGAGAAKKLEVEGADLEGVLAGVRFLHDVAVGSFPATELSGRRVVVVGGGDVALDAARSALRLGASDAKLVCLEAADQMPAHASEIEAAREEGVEILSSWGPERILGSIGCVSGVRFVRCLAVFDDSGRFAPRFDGDETREVGADVVIAAIGQQVERSLREHPGLEFRDGLLRAAQDDESTGTGGVFAAGDVTLGPSSVVRAVASGRTAAERVDRALGGSGEIPSILDPETPAQWTGREEGFGARSRVEPVAVHATERVGDFSEVEMTLACADAEGEAGRCLQCDLRLHISAPVLPPLPWIELTAEAVDGVPATAGVFQLLGEDRVATKIQGTPDLRQALGEELAGDGAAPYFMFEEDAMYTKRESELIQQFLARHGHMPEGDDDLDDLF